MHYLLINGSPHRGNTWKLAALAKTQIAAADPEAECRELHLMDAALPFCTGCSNCFRKGGENCPHKAVMNAIIADIDWADGVVVATGTANMAPPALYKNLEDHLCYLLHRPRFFTQKALVITTTGGVGGGRAAKSIAATLRGMGFNRAYRLAIGSRSWNCFTPNKKQTRKVQRMAACFTADVLSKTPHPPALTTLIPYNLFRGMCPAQVESDYPTVDGDHWTDPARARRCYDAAVPVRWYHRLFGGLFFGIGKIAGGSMEVSYRKQTQA